jgi:hypothetical protein
MQSDDIVDPGDAAIQALLALTAESRLSDVILYFVVRHGVAGEKAAGGRDVSAHIRLQGCLVTGVVVLFIYSTHSSGSRFELTVLSGFCLMLARLSR